MMILAAMLLPVREGKDWNDPLQRQQALQRHHGPAPVKAPRQTGQIWKENFSSWTGRPASSISGRGKPAEVVSYAILSVPRSHCSMMPRR